MSLESQVSDLVDATTDLLAAVNVSKSTLDASVASTVSNAATATTQAGIATTQLGLANGAASAAAASALQAEDARDLAIQAWTASTAPIETLSAVNKTLFPGAIVDSFIYDTSKDSDGGAWRDRCAHLSWYNEPLCAGRWLGSYESEAAVRAAVVEATGDYYYDTTAAVFRSLNADSGTTPVYRGNRAGFPSKVLITAESNRVVLWDLDNGGAMWKVIVRLGDWDFYSVTAMSGVLLIAPHHVAVAPYGCLAVLDFASATVRKYSDNNTVKSGRVTGFPGATWEGFDDYAEYYPLSTLASYIVNDVAMTVLPGAPIDPVTGLAVPTIAVATAGGVSVIKDDGTVVNITGQATPMLFVEFTRDNLIATNTEYYDNVALYRIPTVSGSHRTELWNTVNYTFSINPVAGNYAKLIGNAVMTLKGIVVIKPNLEAPLKSMDAQITSKYNSGWLPGDIRGAWLADSVEEGVTSVNYVTNGDFGSDTDWIKEPGWTIGGNAATHTASVVGAIYQSNSAVIGKTISATFTITAISGAGSYARIRLGTKFYAVFTTIGTYTVTGVPDTDLCAIYAESINGAVSIGNVSFKLADPDRSVKGKGLAVHGTLTKAPVATGASLVAYSGFSANNYLEQPYNSAMDFTGDFSVMFWYKGTNTTESLPTFNRAGTATSIGIYPQATGLFYFLTGDAGGFSNYTPAFTQTAGVWTFVVATRVDGVLSIYINGVLLGSSGALAVRNLTDVSAVLEIGKGVGGYALSQALTRVSATAPSADQIKHIYETERKLFETNAKCVLPEAAITAMDYDDDTGLLHVASAGYRSAWKDLVRVNSETSTTGSLTSVAASGGIVSMGGSTGATLYVPAQNLRDELNRTAEAAAAYGSMPEFFEFDAVTSQTTFVLKKGWTVKAVYSAGTLKREGSTKDYTVVDDGFQESVVFAVAPGNGVWVSVMGVRK